MTFVDTTERPRCSYEWRLAAKSILGFWVLHLVTRTAIAALGGDMDELLYPALQIALAFGFVLSIAFCAILVAAGGRGLAFGLGLAVLLSLPFSVGYAAAELALYYHLSPEVNGAGSSRTLPDGTVVTVSSSGEVSYHPRGQARPTVVKLSPMKQRVRQQAPRIVTSNASGWFYFYFGLGSFFVGMSNAARLRRAERRATEYERLAQSAQLRALRYQINPHFLFNTLNSLSALIMTRRNDQAETMILNLSEFFRSTLAIEPTSDIALSEEIALQRLYLDIESARFPGRLRVEVDIPGELLQARVPALLLQPLVENAIKYGVARSQELVVIRICAARTGQGQLKLTVENGSDAAIDGADDHGTGVGLKNVADRLKARFGDAASCIADFAEAGLFRVSLTFPLASA